MPIDRCFTKLPEVVKQGKRCDIFECLFGMKPIQVRIYFYSLKKPRDIIEIASFINRDRTTALRLTNDLIKKGLIKKTAKKLEKGGIKYSYSGVSEKKAKKMLLETLREMEHALDNFIELNWLKLEEEIEEELNEEIIF